MLATVAPMVSFCIRGWRASMVGRAIESALAQTIDDLEVIVTDDKGDLEEAVRRCDDRRVSYYRNADRLGAAWNARQALNLGRGDFLCLLNDDDWLLPDFAETVLARFAQVPRAGIVFTNHYLERDGRRWVRDAPVVDGTYDDFLVDFMRTTPVCSGSALIRREVWEDGERAHPMPQNTAADAFIAFRASVMKVVFSYVDEPLMVWTLHNDSLMAGLGMRDLSVSLWSSFELADSEAERMRIDHLARAYKGRAAARLQTGRIPEARDDLANARRLGRGSLVLSFFARVPFGVLPAVALKHKLARLWLFLSPRSQA